MQSIVSLITGGVGGNLAGALLKKFSLGPVRNPIVGRIGGGLGGQLLGRLMPPAADGGTGMVGDIAGSAVGGGLLMVVVGVMTNAMANKS